MIGKPADQVSKSNNNNNGASTNQAHGNALDNHQSSYMSQQLQLQRDVLPMSRQSNDLDNQDAKYGMFGSSKQSLNQVFGGYRSRQGSDSQHHVGHSVNNDGVMGGASSTGGDIFNDFLNSPKLNQLPTTTQASLQMNGIGGDFSSLLATNSGIPDPSTALLAMGTPSHNSVDQFGESIKARQNQVFDLGHALPRDHFGLQPSLQTQQRGVGALLNTQFKTNTNDFYLGADVQARQDRQAPQGYFSQASSQVGEVVPSIEPLQLQSPMLASTPAQQSAVSDIKSYQSHREELLPLNLAQVKGSAENSYNHQNSFTQVHQQHAAKIALPQSSLLIPSNLITDKEGNKQKSILKKNPEPKLIKAQSSGMAQNLQAAMSKKSDFAQSVQITNSNNQGSKRKAKQQTKNQQGVGRNIQISQSSSDLTVDLDQCQKTKLGNLRLETNDRSQRQRGDDKRQSRQIDTHAFGVRFGDHKTSRGKSMNFDPSDMMHETKGGCRQDIMSRKQNIHGSSKRSASDSRQRRLEKNRQSARDSRKRKKTYIEALELKNEMIQAENIRLRTINQNLRERQKLATFSSMPSVDDFLSGQEELYEKLEYLLNNEASPSQLESILECLRLRGSAYSVQREQLVNNMFKSVINFSFPNHIKYLFWSSQNNKGLFEPVTPQEERSTSPIASRQVSPQFSMKSSSGDGQSNDSDTPRVERIQIPDSQEESSQNNSENSQMDEDDEIKELDKRAFGRENQMEIEGSLNEIDTPNELSELQSHSEIHSTLELHSPIEMRSPLALQSPPSELASVTSMSSPKTMVSPSGRVYRTRNRKPTKYVLDELNQEQQDEWKQMLSWIGFTKKQRKKLQEKQQQVKERQTAFQSLIDQMVSTKRKFLQELINLEDMTDELGGALNIEQQAKLLVCSEKLKSKSQMNIFKFHQASFQQQQQQQQAPAPTEK